MEQKGLNNDILVKGGDLLEVSGHDIKQVTSIKDRNKYAIEAYDHYMNDQITQISLQNIVDVLNDPLISVFDKDILERQILVRLKREKNPSKSQSKGDDVIKNTKFRWHDICEKFPLIDIKAGCYGIVANANFGKQLISSYFLDKIGQLCELRQEIKLNICNIRFNERSDVSINEKIINGTVSPLPNNAEVNDVHIVGGLFDLLPALLDDSNIIIINSINSALYAMNNSTLIKGGIDKEKIDSMIETLQALGESLNKIIIFVYRATDSELSNSIDNIMLGSCWGMFSQQTLADKPSSHIVKIQLKGYDDSKGIITISKQDMLQEMKYLYWRNSDEIDEESAKGYDNLYSKYFG